MLKRIRNSILVTFLVLTLFTVGCNNAKEPVMEEKATLTGTVEAREIDIRNKIPGEIKTLKVEEGQSVKKGDLLYEIDPKDLIAKKMQAEAGINGAEAQLNKAISGARAQEIAQIEALLAKANAKVQLLQTKYDRLLQLYEAEALPKDKLDDVETELTVAKLDVEAVTAQLSLAQEGANKDDIAALRAQASGAKAVLAEVNLHIQDTKVYAPFDGVVSEVIAKEGELIGQGTPVLTISNYQDKWVEANMDEIKVVDIKIGDEVEFVSKAYPDEPFKGKIVSLNQNPDFAIKKSTNELNEKDTITYAVKINVLADERTLLPGMMVDILLKDKNVIEKDTKENDIKDKDIKNGENL
ncbi:HlyD family secretion protein [Desulfonispora thiosulfatigenes DSM 11270]|uniref:HlyD family secretion protein n=1 Tax=Desulfonispora thiosulfatigenes DSM 11270 TaxID=656914 RepID=A0A1W1UUD0_DESTI|nr:efflux RND transporter periplasmic adaptor subunit [Desulfonispora thiosulfatigenes]SMB84673.1 HlyD family secretion protein [Desulfonispora thiosulfatigenes DSM 11270]